MEFLSVFTQDKSYLESMEYLDNMRKRGGAVTMCAVADALKTEGRQEGKVELLLEMDYTISEIADRLGMSVEEVEKVLERIR